jgi:hypothetical protein
MIVSVMTEIKITITFRNPSRLPTFPLRATKKGADTEQNIYNFFNVYSIKLLFLKALNSQLPMKKSFILLLAFALFIALPAGAQVGKFLKNVKNAVQQDLLGTPDNSKQLPEPNCACNDAIFIFDVGKYKVDYSELNINILDDGGIVVQDRLTNNYYVVRGGVTEGPLKTNDPRIRQYEVYDMGDEGRDDIFLKYKEYIKRQGDKYLITFAGKSYGPYAQIQRFAVTRSKDKFAATVTETIIATEDDSKKMEEAINNAKTDQEKIELAMKYSQQIQDKMMSGGGPGSILPKIISNQPIQNLSENFNIMGSLYSTTMKYDEILLMTESGITNLDGKVICPLAFGMYDPDKIYISSDNTRYAKYDYGTLTFSDGKVLSDLFNVSLMKSDSKIYLTYMYYSPKKNAMLQCRLPF